jgi:hypothetical protein
MLEGTPQVLLEEEVLVQQEAVFVEHCEESLVEAQAASRAAADTRRSVFSVFMGIWILLSFLWLVLGEEVLSFQNRRRGSAQRKCPTHFRIPLRKSAPSVDEGIHFMRDDFCERELITTDGDFVSLSRGVFSNRDL